MEDELYIKATGKRWSKLEKEILTDKADLDGEY